MPLPHHRFIGFEASRSFCNACSARAARRLHGVVRVIPRRLFADRTHAPLSPSVRTPVVLRKQMTAKPKSELALHNAKAKGQVETVSRAGQPSSSASAAARLDDNDAADFHQEKVITLE